MTNASTSEITTISSERMSGVSTRRNRWNVVGEHVILEIMYTPKIHE